MPDWPEPLARLLAEEAATPVPEAVERLAVAARAAVGDEALAVLYYGSALRDGMVEGRLVDLYVVTAGYARVPGGACIRRLARVLPPNVHYLEMASDDGVARAKYAVVALDQLERLVGRGTKNPYFWARLSQPTAIVWAIDDAVRSRLIGCLAQAADTLLAATRPLLAPDAPSRAVWSRAFAETYRSELRAEPPERGATIYDAAPARYDAVLEALRTRPTEPAATVPARWARRRPLGKLLSALRLVKAAFTFSGGADYIAWKIARHSGVEVRLSPWQRRHPLLAAPGLFWRLYRARAFR
jgi:hypothetical protein